MILYLTSAERKLYDALPAELRNAWSGSVEIETGDAWETPQELQERLQTAPLHRFPKVAAYAQRAWLALKSGRNLEPLANDLPPESLPILLHLMGATGLSKLMEQMFFSIKTVHEIDTLAHFSDVRHMLLSTNNVIRLTLAS